ncbi:hypothetical protein GWK47_028658 [Chionoecetes opilio]|uniref:Uncharacterized protein n=1 Tax=Chionoecetes opilio TaxID=41210 RepID=A0A8J4YYK1_CHIOP|nr:hypothetical protein GWK47_028658 [Chionoecetes opilio]
MAVVAMVAVTEASIWPRPRDCKYWCKDNNDKLYCCGKAGTTYPSFTSGYYSIPSLNHMYHSTFQSTAVFALQSVQHVLALGRQDPRFAPMTVLVPLVASAAMTSARSTTYARLLNIIRQHKELLDRNSCILDESGAQTSKRWNDVTQKKSICNPMSQ